MLNKENKSYYTNVVGYLLEPLHMSKLNLNVCEKLTCLEFGANIFYVKKWIKILYIIFLSKMVPKQTALWTPF